jgi:hypothetical protein
MPAVRLARYRDRCGRERELCALCPGQALLPIIGGRAAVARLAARLSTRPGLVLDVARAPGDLDARVLARLDAGEGLLAAQAVCDEYRPRAERALVPLAPPLASALGDGHPAEPVRRAA